MRYEQCWYTTKDQRLEVEFLMLHLSPTRGWRAYILTDIDYKSRDRRRPVGLSDTHRHFESSQERYIDADRSYPFVCWNQPIRDLDVMKNVAAVWCEITSYYIRHGGSFQEIQRKLSAKGVI